MPGTDRTLKSSLKIFLNRKKKKLGDQQYIYRYLHQNWPQAKPLLGAELV